jgi:hypothetical protein
MSEISVDAIVIIYGLFLQTVQKIYSNNILVKLKGGILMNCHPIYTKLKEEHNG